MKFALKLLFVIELVEFFFIDIIRSELNKMAYTIELDALYAYQYAKSIGLCKEVKIAEISFPGLDFGGKNRFDWRAIKKNAIDKLKRKCRISTNIQFSRQFSGYWIIKIGFW